METGRGMMKENKLFQVERKRNILSILNEQPSVTVSCLSKKFHVSEVTIRKDLKELDRSGYLTRTHGGAAVGLKMAFESNQSEKEKQNILEKTAIANIAYERIQNGDSILFDAGSTTLQLAKKIKSNPAKKILAVTNSLNIANELVDLENVELIMLGGTFRTGIYSLVGPITESNLQTLHVDKVFLGINSINLVHGLSTANIYEAEIKRRMLLSAEEKFLLADHTKFGAISLKFIAHIGELNYLVTDSLVPNDTVKAIEQMGVAVLISPCAAS
jgi:DeoR/GlpR family transcriptional regulator of sugar metabolism